MHFTPSFFAIEASPCEKFPELAVHTPFFSCSWFNCLIVLLAGRALNDLMDWRVSSFRYISAGVSTFNLIIGVRMMSSAILFWASLISSRGIGSYLLNFCCS